MMQPLQNVSGDPLLKDHCWCSRLYTAAMELITRCKTFKSQAFTVHGHTLTLTGGIPLHLKFTLWKYSGGHS